MDTLRAFLNLTRNSNFFGHESKENIPSLVSEIEYAENLLILEKRIKIWCINFPDIQGELIKQQYKKEKTNTNKDVIQLKEQIISNLTKIYKEENRDMNVGKIIQLPIEQGTFLECKKDCKFGRVEVFEKDIFVVTNNSTDQNKNQAVLIDRKKRAKLGIGYLISIEDLNRFFKQIK